MGLFACSQHVACEADVKGNEIAVDVMDDLVASETSYGSVATAESYLPPSTGDVSVPTEQPSGAVTESVPGSYLPPDGTPTAAGPTTDYGTPGQPDGPSDSYGTPGTNQPGGNPSESYGTPGSNPSDSYGTPSVAYGTPQNNHASVTIGDNPSALYGAPSAGYGSPQIISSETVPETDGGVSQVPVFTDDSVTIPANNEDFSGPLPADSYSAVVPVRGAAEDSSYAAPAATFSNGPYGPPTNAYLPPAHGGFGQSTAPNAGYLPPNQNGGSSGGYPGGNGQGGYGGNNNGANLGGYNGNGQNNAGGYGGGNNGGYNNNVQRGNNGGFNNVQRGNNGGYNNVQRGNNGGYNNVQRGNNGGYNNFQGGNNGGYNNARNNNFRPAPQGGPRNGFQNVGYRAPNQAQFYRQPVRNAGYINQRPSYAAPRGGGYA